MASDRIILRNMQFFGYHGTRPEERSLGQRFVVDIELHLDLRAAGTSDDLNQTVDYSAVHRTARAIVEGPPFQLTEAVAERIAAAVLAEHLLIEQIDVTVGKPGVRLDDTVLDGSFVSISRRRG